MRKKKRDGVGRAKKSKEEKKEFNNHDAPLKKAVRPGDRGDRENMKKQIRDIRHHKTFFAAKPIAASSAEEGDRERSKPT